jgi:hypothetical protein
MPKCVVLDAVQQWLSNDVVRRVLAIPTSDHRHPFMELASVVFGEDFSRANILDVVQPLCKAKVDQNQYLLRSFLVFFLLFEGAKEAGLTKDVMRAFIRELDHLRFILGLTYNQAQIISLMCLLEWRDDAAHHYVKGLSCAPELSDHIRLLILSDLHSCPGFEQVTIAFLPAVISCILPSELYSQESLQLIVELLSSYHQLFEALTFIRSRTDDPAEINAKLLERMFDTVLATKETKGKKDIEAIWDIAQLPLERIEREVFQMIARGRGFSHSEISLFERVHHRTDLNT